jgi:hypothetical protein
MTKIVNIQYLRILFLQIIDGIFIRQEQDLRNFEPALLEFRAMLDEATDLDEFGLELKKTMRLAIQFPDAFSLNTIFHDATDVYLVNDDEVVKLLRLAMKVIFAEGEVEAATSDTTAFEIIDVPVAF